MVFAEDDVEDCDVVWSWEESRALPCNCSHVHLAISIFLVVLIIHSSLLGHTVCYFNTTNLYQSLLDNHIVMTQTEEPEERDELSEDDEPPIPHFRPIRKTTRPKWMNDYHEPKLAVKKG